MESVPDSAVGRQLLKGEDLTDAIKQGEAIWRK